MLVGAEEALLCLISVLAQWIGRQHHRQSHPAILLMMERVMASHAREERAGWQRGSNLLSFGSFSVEAAQDLFAHITRIPPLGSAFDQTQLLLFSRPFKIMSVKAALVY